MIVRTFGGCPYWCGGIIYDHVGLIRMRYVSPEVERILLLAMNNGIKNIVPYGPNFPTILNLNNTDIIRSIFHYIADYNI